MPTEPEIAPWIGPLLQFSSANLPVGAYSYSQGLEWAIESGWVHDVDTLKAWCRDWIDGPMAQQEVKHIPLGQSDGQRTMMQLWPALHEAIARSCHFEDDDIGFSLPGASFASAAHETQYTRLYRS